MTFVKIAAIGAGLFLLLIALAGLSFAQVSTAPPSGASQSAQGNEPVKVAAPKLDSAIPPGTTITMQNWQQYRQFMPDGMAALFDGKYFWKMPADVSIEVGPTVIHPLPKNYLAATEKYAQQVRVVDLPNGGLTLQGYRGGIPFPRADEPHKGWKILANLWFRYIPHLIVDTYGDGCGINSQGGRQCFAYQVVINQLSFNTDPGMTEEVPGSSDKFITEWFMFLEPEQERYSTTLTIDYADPAKAEDMYVFLPALRRYQPLSTFGRCSPSPGLDATPEDYRYGFDSNITDFQVEFVGEKKMLALLDAQLPSGPFPEGFAMPLGWPTPSWGKWQLRDVDVIAVSKVPAKARGYCYGKRVMYVDREYSGPVWEELYDSKMRPWKFIGLFSHSVDVPGVGLVNSAGSDVEMFWNIQDNHATYSSDPALGRPLYVNERAPKEFSDLPRYTTPAGLNLIMR